MKQRDAKKIRTLVREVLEDELGAVLRDVSWRLRHFTDLSDKVPAERLNLSQHLLTGYTVTANDPAPGSIAWADLHVVYQGTEYGPFAGDTNMLYVWFDADHATSKIQTSNTKPTLSADDAILFVNNGGTPVEVLKSQLVSGKLLIDGSVDSGELADAAITAAKIFDGAVGSTKIADDAVTTAKIGPSAVTATELNDGAVTTTKIGADAVTTDKIGPSAVTATELGDDAVTAAKIADGAVGTAAVAAGGINTSKLNLLQHLIF